MKNLVKVLWVSRYLLVCYSHIFCLQNDCSWLEAVAFLLLLTGTSMHSFCACWRQNLFVNQIFIIIIFHIRTTAQLIHIPMRNNGSLKSKPFMFLYIGSLGDQVWNVFLS